MSSKVKVQVHSKLPSPTLLYVHPQMTARELTEFVCASALLHREKGDAEGDRGSIPIGIISKQNNLMVDYLLTSTETTISRINSLIEYLPK